MYYINKIKKWIKDFIKKHIIDTCPDDINL